MNKRGLIWGELRNWLIALLVLVIISISYFLLSGKLNGWANYFRGLI